MRRGRGRKLSGKLSLGLDLAVYCPLSASIVSMGRTVNTGIFRTNTLACLRGLSHKRILNLNPRLSRLRIPLHHRHTPHTVSYTHLTLPTKRIV